MWDLLRPTRIGTEKELWDGSYGFLSLSEKTRISNHLLICHKKGSTISSQFIINLHTYTFSLSGKKDDRSPSTQSIAFMSNAERNWYFCFFIAYREPNSFCRAKRGKKSARKASRGRASSCSFSLRRRLWQSRGTGNSLTWSLRSHVTFTVIWEPSRIACSLSWCFTIFLGVFYLLFFPGITMWVVNLMCENLVSGLHYLVNVLVQNFSIYIMTRSAQNMQFVFLFIECASLNATGNSL